MNSYGLIGKTLKHSFSQQYFADKFSRERIDNAQYGLFEIDSIDNLPRLVEEKNLKGINVTIPFKLDVIPLLSSLDETAQKVGAVNVIKIGKQWIGYNSDYFGFKKSLIDWSPLTNQKALILGSGGASMAVKAVLNDLSIDHLIVSRSKGDINYEVINESDLLKEYHLVINCTPLGTFPNVDAIPPLNYDLVGNDHYFYDLVYNPEVTSFMRKASEKGAIVKNGLEMLELQAEKSWEIWNQK